VRHHLSQGHWEWRGVSARKLAEVPISKAYTEGKNDGDMGLSGVHSRADGRGPVPFGCSNKEMPK
jgi:hypothetical protein